MEQRRASSFIGRCKPNNRYIHFRHNWKDGTQIDTYFTIARPNRRKRLAAFENRCYGLDSFRATISSVGGWKVSSILYHGVETG